MPDESGLNSADSQSEAGAQRVAIQKRLGVDDVAGIAAAVEAHFSVEGCNAWVRYVNQHRLRALRRRGFEYKTAVGIGGGLAGFIA